MERYLVKPGNKNLVISRIVVETLDGLKMSYPEPEEDLNGAVIE